MVEKFESNVLRLLREIRAEVKKLKDVSK